MALNCHSSLCPGDLPSHLLQSAELHQLAEKCNPPPIMKFVLRPASQKEQSAAADALHKISRRNSAPGLWGLGGSLSNEVAQL